MLVTETVFVSRLESVLPAEELRFRATPGFGRYKRFLSHAIAHPAKMNTRLTKFLIAKFTRKGDVVLDPMGGTGQTGIIATLHGRNAVCVELEEKFHGWMEEAKRKVARQQTLAKKGTLTNLLGDSRRLSELLTKADVVVTSPPYSKTVSKQGGSVAYKRVGISTLTSRKYSDDPKNIGNLKHGTLKGLLDVKVLDGKGRIRIQKTCLNCGVTFLVHPYRKDTAKYCSYRCCWQSKKGVHFSLETEFKRESYPDVNEKQIELIVGTILGDGYLDTKPKYPRLQVAHSDNQKKYFDWKLSILNNLLTSKPLYCKNTNSWSICTITHPIFAQVKKMFKNGITKELLDSLTLFSIAVWFMDDASCDRGMAITLAACGYSDEENQIIKEWFNVRFGINVIVEKKGKYPLIRFKKKDAFVISQLLKPYSVPSMAYKFEIENMYHRKPIWHGQIDTVITSPPYADGTKGKSRSPFWEKLANDPTSNRFGRKEHPTIGEGYGKDDENIGNLPFDCVITSPPYEDGMSDKRHTLNTERQRKISKEKHWTTRYGNNENNIGKLTKETYLEAMLQVYREMWKVLKPQGKAIIVIKPFIRNKQVVDLPYHTWLLLKKAGFNLVQLFKLLLKSESFWRVLYSKKFPDVPRIKHEYVMVCEKEAVA